MRYLKIVNCPLGGCLIKKGNKIDWEIMGFDASEVSRLLVQGFTECVDGKGSGDYMTIIPINNDGKFELIKSEIIDNINNNDFENDSAEVVEQSIYEEYKDLVCCVKTKIESGESGLSKKEEDIEKFKGIYKLVDTITSELNTAKSNLEIEGCTVTYKTLTQIQIDSLELKLITATTNRNKALEEYVTKYTDGTDEKNIELVEEFTTALVGV